jgi:glycosyltransferase involved in cell wall biosynthesis
MAELLYESAAFTRTDARGGRDAVEPAASRPHVSLIVPCFNEQDAIVKTILELRAALRNLGDYELIVIDDGSTDGTAAILKAEQLCDPSLRVISHALNRGYGAALKTGIRASRGELIVITDADGTYPNHRLPDLIQLAAHADMVVGARTGDEVTYPFIRRVPKLFLQAYAKWIAQADIPDLNSGMRVLRRRVVDRFLNILPDGFSFTTTITLALLTNRYIVQYVAISYSARIGRSKIRPIRDTAKFFQLVLRTGMYFAPLRVYGPMLWLMFLAFAASICYDVFVLEDLTEKTLLLMILFINSTMFALLADMIDKRSTPERRDPPRQG